MGRHLSRPRLLGPTALACFVSGTRKGRLVVEAARGRAGLYLLTPDEAAALAALWSEEPGAPARQALLLLRKHLDGARVSGVRRIPGERHLIVACGDVKLSLRLWGAPALTLVAADRALATLGPGREAWPLPEGDPRADPEVVGAKAEATLALPGALADLTDAELVGERSASVAPAAPPRPPGVLLALSTWREAFARFLELRSRGDAFAARRREQLALAQRELKKLRSLERHLTEDAAAQADPELLRRQAEALLAAPASVPPGAREAALPDPYEPSRTIRVELAPAKDAIANAQRLFEKARRIARGRAQVATRLEQARLARGVAEERLLRVEAARRVADLAAPKPASRRAPARAGAAAASGKRHYLTSRGLSLHVGRGAKENHRLTFELARPEDLWFHARDTPGAHVILRDDQGRSTAEDLREAAEVAAFFSDAAGSKAVDVHCARRKHLRPGRGGPGRALVGHSETLRVSPRDPEGRLRRR